MYRPNILFFLLKYVEFSPRSFVLFLVLGRIIYEREVFLKWIDQYAFFFEGVYLRSKNVVRL